MATTSTRGSAQASAFAIKSADVSRVQPFRWAWQDWVLCGYLNLLVGDEGVGKGVTLSHLAARWTRGQLPGDLTGRPARVLLIGDEDGFDDVWTTRLMAAGADLDYIDCIEGEVDVGKDADRLSATIRERKVDVVIFDQLLDQLGAKVNDWRSKDVRHALQPLRRVARETGVAPLLVLHTNKGDGATFRQRVSGSQGFNALSRSSLLLAEHPDDETLRIVARGKGNYSRTPTPLEFGIRSKVFKANGHTFDVPVLHGLTDSNVSLDDALNVEAPSTKAERGRMIAREALADGQWHPAAPIIAAMIEAGLSERGAYRVADDLDPERKRDEFGGVAHWRLPLGGCQ